MGRVWQGERKNKESVRGKMGRREEGGREGGREGGKEEREGGEGREHW